MIKIDHSTETDSDINPIEDKSESLETKGEDGKEEKQKPLMGPKGKKITKDIAEGAFTVFTKIVKITIKGIAYMFKLIFNAIGGKGAVVLVGVLLIGGRLGLRSCGKGTGKMEIKKIKIGDIITPDDRVDDIMVGDNTYTYGKTIEVDNQAGKVNLFGKTLGIPLGPLDKDKITATVKANVESGYLYKKIKELPIEVSRKLDKDGEIIREEVDIQDMSIIDTLKVIFEEGTGITEEKSVCTKLGLDDEEMKKLLVDSLNGERIQEIMKLHGENLNRNGEEFRRLSIKKMRQLLISGRKLTDKDAPEDMYLKITFGDWLGKKYTYATDGTTIVSLGVQELQNNEGQNKSINIHVNPDDYGALFGKKYPKE